MRFVEGLVHLDKVQKYLFNRKHVEGWPKGRFLQSIGFDPTYPSALTSALLDQASRGKILATQTIYGTKLEIDGTLKSPTNKVVNVRTVWLIDVGRTVPRFVTLKPLRKLP
jgi:hypothetical protein